MKAKICGITNLKDAIIACKLGAWALGFNFYASSPRYVTKEKAKEIITQLPKNVIKIGVCVDTLPNEMLATMEETGLDFIQVYRDYTMNDQIKKKCILCLQASNLQQVPQHNILKKYSYILLDAPRTENGLYGGTGQKAKWDIAHILAKKYPLILAGGLNGNNVKEAIDSVHPFAIDVASGVEQSPGIKNHDLVEKFLHQMRYER